MKNLFDLTNALLISLLLTVFTFAQPPAKTPAPTELRSLKTLPATEKFTSAEGRFTIALPKDGVDFEAIAPTEESPKETGSRYAWSLKEGVITIDYSDDPDLVIKTEKDYADMAEGMESGVAVFNGKTLSKRALMTGKYRGYEIRFIDPHNLKGISRMYIVEGRRYTLLGLSSPDSGDGVELLIKAIDTFELVPAGPTPTKIYAEDWKKIDGATPPALPQETAVKKERSDAYDDGLKGKVKTLTEEILVLNPGPASTRGRHFTMYTDFDTRGDRLRSVMFQGSKGPYDITVYGYIDGDRVSISRSVTPSTARFTIVGDKPVKPLHAPDPRYDTKWLYKYSNGKLMELRVQGNDGAPGMLHVYKYDKNVREEFAYDKHGEPNQKIHYILDEKGNEIERIGFDVMPHKPDGGKATRFPINIISFDTAGNWTERTISELVVENGKPVSKHVYTEYRTITYYP